MSNVQRQQWIPPPLIPLSYEKKKRLHGRRWRWPWASGASTTAPDRAANYLTWPDGAAYAELGGDMQERTVTVGSPQGRAFTGEHGDGALAGSTADANVANWPGADTAGIGSRGGNANNAATTFARTSDRTQAALVTTARLNYYGWRGVRTAP